MCQAMTFPTCADAIELIYTTRHGNWQLHASEVIWLLIRYAHVPVSSQKMSMPTNPLSHIPGICKTVPVKVHARLSTRWRVAQRYFVTVVLLRINVCQAAWYLGGMACSLIFSSLHDRG
jgi:hypothetical protein